MISVIMYTIIIIIIINANIDHNNYNIIIGANNDRNGVKK